jgi:hypothetical protein
VMCGFTVRGAWERFLKGLSAYSRDLGPASPCMPHGAAYVSVATNSERIVIPVFMLDVVASVYITLSLLCDSKKTESNRVTYSEIIVHNLSKAGWCCGCISSTDHDGRQFWVVAAEREDGGRFIVRADEKLSAFSELERAIYDFALDSIS